MDKAIQAIADTIASHLTPKHIGDGLAAVLAMLARDLPTALSLLASTMSITWIGIQMYNYFRKGKSGG